MTCGTTIAVIMYLAFDEYREEISKVETELRGDSWDMSAIPDTVRHRERRLRPRDCTTRSDTNELVDPGSNRARALMEVPSGALILTWQVIKRVLGRLDPAEA